MSLPSKEGEARVELLDLKGDALAASGPVTRYSLRHQVKWNSDIAVFAGSPVVLRFNLKNATLFAFAFRK